MFDGDSAREFPGIGVSFRPVRDPLRNRITKAVRAELVEVRAGGAHRTRRIFGSLKQSLVWLRSPALRQACPERSRRACPERSRRAQDERTGRLPLGWHRMGKSCRPDRLEAWRSRNIRNPEAARAELVEVRASGGPRTLRIVGALKQRLGGFVRSPFDRLRANGAGGVIPWGWPLPHPQASPVTLRRGDAAEPPTSAAAAPPPS